MRPLHPVSLLAAATAFLTGCSGFDPVPSPPPPAPPVPLTPVEAASASTAPGPSVPSLPKPSLSKLTNRERPNLEFFGATIYADAINGLEASGHVFIDGTNLHRIQRAFPIAVYAGKVHLDPANGQATISGWPIVQTDGAYLQGQSPETVIHLSRDKLSRIDGPARYVLGDKGAALFAP